MIRRAPKFDPDQWSNDATLAMLCPKCGGNNLHQTTVHVFNRGEDDEKVTCTAVFTDCTDVRTIPNDIAGNPSSRRHGLTIEFECENCHQGDVDLFCLDIWQHKGTTYMVWRTE